MKDMSIKRSINGKPAEWTPAIQAKWDSFEKPDGIVTHANWYTARPYVDEYNTGSTKEGFVYTVAGQYSKVYDSSWEVGKPDAPYLEPKS